MNNMKGKVYFRWLGLKRVYGHLPQWKLIDKGWPQWAIEAYREGYMYYGDEE